MNQFDVINQQWNTMLSSGTMPCFEFELKDNEYLLVELELNETNKEIIFSFDSMNLKTWFSGNVKQYHDCKFAIAIDEYTISLDALLELVYEEITEGFIIPNDLLPSE